MSNKRSSRGSRTDVSAKGASGTSMSAAPVGRQGRPSYAQRRAAQERAEQRRKRMTVWGTIAAAVACVAIVAILFLVNHTVTPAGAQTIAGIQCDSNEQVSVHYHQHLRIVANGKEVTVPAGIGIYQDPDQTKSCLYWLHTHDTRGVIHVEAPKDGPYTLGNFFSVWRQPLSATQIMSYKTDATHSIRAYVNGKLYTGNPAAIQLKPHGVLTLEYGPPFVAPKPYTFTGGE